MEKRKNTWSPFHLVQLEIVHLNFAQLTVAAEAVNHLMNS